jgi:hypothetical protein
VTTTTRTSGPRAGRVFALAALAAVPLWLAPGCLQPGEFNNEEQYRLNKPDAPVTPPETDGDPPDSGPGPGSDATEQDTATPQPDTNQPPQDSGQPPQDRQQPPADTNQPPTGVTVSIEAESGMGIAAPMMTTDDAMASGGKFISSNHGTVVNATPAMTTAGVVTYMFTVSAMGTYKVFGRIKAPVIDSDSFWVKMDQGAWIQWNNIPPNTNWAWDDVHDTAMADMTVTFMLSQGMHTFSVTYREQNTPLDKLVITSNPTFVPTGMGP